MHTGVRIIFHAHTQVSLAPGELPLAFEGEERSTAGLGDVMQVRSRRSIAMTYPLLAMHA